LKRRGMKSIVIRPFLVDYEWVTAVKKGRFEPPGRAEKPIVLPNPRNPL
jgi:hypothetical protein